jgi:hypothetical protein
VDFLPAIEWRTYILKSRREKITVIAKEKIGHLSTFSNWKNAGIKSKRCEIDAFFLLVIKIRAIPLSCSENENSVGIS